MRERSMLPLQDLKSRLIWLVLAAVTVPAFAQSPVDGNRDAASQSSSSQDLATAIQELRAQVQELRATVTDMKSEAAEYRAHPCISLPARSGGLRPSRPWEDWTGTFYRPKPCARA